MPSGAMQQIHDSKILKSRFNVGVKHNLPLFANPSQQLIRVVCIYCQVKQLGPGIQQKDDYSQVELIVKALGRHPKIHRIASLCLAPTRGYVGFLLMYDDFPLIKHGLVWLREAADLDG